MSVAVKISVSDGLELELLELLELELELLELLDSTDSL
jgi:hypothetical protein